MQKHIKVLVALTVLLMIPLFASTASAERKKRKNSFSAKCGKDAKRLCKGVKRGDGRLRKCLKKRKNKKKVSQKCKQFLKRSKKRAGILFGGKVGKKRVRKGKKGTPKRTPKDDKTNSDNETPKNDNSDSGSGGNDADIAHISGFGQNAGTNCMTAAKQVIQGHIVARYGGNKVEYESGAKKDQNVPYPKKADGSRPARGFPYGAIYERLWHIQVLYGEHTKKGTWLDTSSANQNAIKANTQRLIEGIDIMLAAGKWVHTGVKYKTRAITEHNNDRVTHHWLVIVKKLGTGRYQYHDVANGKLSVFKYDAGTGLLLDKTTRDGGMMVTRVTVDTHAAKASSRLLKLSAESWVALGNGQKTLDSFNKPSSESYRTLLKSWHAEAKTCLNNFSKCLKRQSDKYKKI